MNIEDLIHEKKNLEKDLLEFIQSKISEFTKNTGLSIYDINVSFLKVQSLGNETPRWLVTDVNCHGDFFNYV